MKKSVLSVRLIDAETSTLGRAMLAASKCYDSKPSTKALDACIRSGHMSVMDHVSLSYEVSGISRACLAQLTRYRVGVAFTVRSQRYCDESASAVVVPPSIAKTPIALAEYISIMDAAFGIYSALIKHGIPKEDARFVLPNACETSLVMTVDVTELIHMANQRLCTRAQWEIREFFERVVAVTVERLPSLRPYLVPTCERLGYCPEVRQGCGRKPTLAGLLSAANSSGYFEAYAEMEADGKLENGNGIE